MSDPGRIWLQPACTVESYEGRAWCTEPEDCPDCDSKSVEYIRADVVTSQHAALMEAARALVAKLDEVNADKSFQALWLYLHVHEYSYSGPTWESELEAARSALKAAGLEL